jgi:hypothetical protein
MYNLFFFEVSRSSMSRIMRKFTSMNVKALLKYPFLQKDPMFVLGNANVSIIKFLSYFPFAPIFSVVIQKTFGVTVAVYCSKTGP